ncbi:hypothetical protein [Ruegeria sp. HKCCD7303]|uniref:hypothetical protein n=1 Tax=Ruegeria sp. HKCCD7303 TaxID=2683013 RepID=UPI001491C64E|nr:hypothetical protein [Ruegeria sp. HKCCD7303]NOD68532.1 hypothetical protein [Ruegeria sp. HKCCD7303]
MDWLTNNAEEIRLISTVLGIVAALFGFYKFYLQRVEQSQKLDAERRQQTISSWRKAKLQEIMTQSDNLLSIGQLTEKLKASAFDVEFDIEKDDLKEQTVRLLVLELVRDGILVQFLKDIYGLKLLPYNPAAQLTADQVKGNQALRAAFAKIVDFPGRYDSARLFDEVGVEAGLSKADFLLAISDFERMNLASKNAEGFWSPNSSSSVPN